MGHVREPKKVCLCSAVWKVWIETLLIMSRQLQCALHNSRSIYVCRLPAMK